MQLNHASARSVSRLIIALLCAVLAVFFVSAGSAHALSSPVIHKSGLPATAAGGGNGVIVAKKRRHCTKRQIRKKRCAHTKTSKKQDSARGPKIDPLAPSDGRGAGPSGTQGAIDWALAQSGRTDYYWWCLKFVAHAFGAQFAGYDSPVAMMAARGANRGEPPVGSLVLFGAVRGNPYGHVGIYLGNNKMINALQTVRISPLSYIPNYRGWLPAPSNWPGRPPSNPAPDFVAPGYTPPNAQPKPQPSTPACAASGGTSAGGSGNAGYHVEDIFYGGTWARTNTCDGTWYAKSTKPANAVYWYPNGLGVGVDCARAGASYTVKWANGTVQTWNTWFHVTDGKWFPSAAAKETAANGFYGLPGC